MSKNKQIEKLANFIMAEVDGEPFQSEGVVDTAIRIIRKYRSALEELSKLGNEPHLGNSDGNRIAQKAIEA